MREVLTKIFLPAAVVLLCVTLIPVNTFGASIKSRHILTVYSDNGAENPVQFRQPQGVGCNEKHFIVADSGNGRILRYTLDGDKITPEPEIKMFQLVYPLKVQINSTGDIYALDGKKRRIVRIGPDGKFKNYVDPKGLPSADEFVPKSFALDMNDNIYILDVFSARVLVLSSEGEYLREMKFPEDYGFFSDLTVDFKGDTLLIDSTKARVVMAKKDSSSFFPLKDNLREHVRFPSTITTDNRGRMYIVDLNGSLIIVLGQDGSFLGQVSNKGWKDGLLNHPSQACINVQGALFVADKSNNRVQIFELLR